MENRKSDHETKIKTEVVDTADKLLTKLRLTNIDEWNPLGKDHPARDHVEKKQWERQWYFRGQRNSDWLLIPSAWRESPNQDTPIELGKQDCSPISKAIGDIRRSGLLWYYDEDRMKPVVNAALQIFLELKIVREFIDLSDSIGHRIPSSKIFGITDGQLAEYIVRELVGFSRDSWLREIWFDPAIALAQHHGIQTRLLDWTRSPAAAYFAARDAVEHLNDPPQSGRLAIYAIRTPSYYLPVGRYEGRVRRVQVYRGENEFLRAQEGVLFVDTSADEDFINNGKYTDLIDALFPKDAKFIPEPLKKFELPVSEASELLRLLSIERVTKAHLMPTLDNAAQTIISKWRSILGKHKQDATQINLLDVVALTEDVPGAGLVRGHTGTVVSVHEPRVYEVEFIYDDGSTYAMLTLRDEQLMLLHVVKHPAEAKS